MLELDVRARRRPRLRYALAVSKPSSRRNLWGTSWRATFTPKQRAWSDAIAKYRYGLKLVGTADLAIRLTEALRAADNNPKADKITAPWL